MIYMILIFIFQTFTAIQAQTPPETDTADKDTQTAEITDGATSVHTQISAILPEGYQISGRKAKLIKLEDDNRWFLAFEEVFSNENQPSSSTIVSTYKSAAQTTSSAAQMSQTAGGATAPTKQSEITTSKSETDSPMRGVDEEHFKTAANPWANPMQVLPGKWLTAMSKVVNNRVDMSIDFRIWGEVTTFHNRNYVLPHFVATLSLFGQEASVVKESSGLGALESSMGLAEKDRAATTESKLQADVDKDTTLPENLRQVLLSIPRTRPVALTEGDEMGGELGNREKESSLGRLSPSELHPSKGWTESQPKLAQMLGAATEWNDGTMVIDRVGRILYYPGIELWLFTFEADGESLAEPPVILHPCQLLELVEQLLDQTMEPIKFRITGQISKYQGQSYMLLRKALIVYDSDNLGK